MMYDSWGKPMHFDRSGSPITLAQWRVLFEESDRAVADSALRCRGKEVQVSTAWLGLNHNFLDPDGPPLIFETTVWGGPMDGTVRRYSTEEEAKAGHSKTVQEVRLCRILWFRRTWRAAKSMLRAFKYSMIRPRSAKTIRLFLWFWIVAWLLAVATVLGNIFYGHNWPLLPVHVTTLFLDTVLLRWTVKGYRWTRARQKAEAARLREEREFARIMAAEFRPDS